MIGSELQTKLAWLAGLIDGEGCIGVYATNNGRSLAWQFSITMRDEGPIREVAKIASHLGIEAPIKQRAYKNGTLYKWGVYNRKALKTLFDAILPFLVLKRPQAGIARCLIAQKAGKPRPIQARLARFVRDLNQRTSILSHTP